MGGWIALGILALLACLPLGVDVNYDEAGILASVAVWKFSIPIYPRPKKEEEKPKKEPEKKAPTAAEEPLPKPPQPPKQPAGKMEKKGGSLMDLLPFVKLAFRFLGDLRRKLRVDVLEVKLTMAGSDPADLATNYGRTWAAIGNLLPQLERFLVIKKRDIQVQCDFTAAKTLILAHIRLTITLGRVLGLLVVYAVRAVIEFLNFKNKRKGGAQNEPEVT